MLTRSFSHSGALKTWLSIVFLASGKQESSWTVYSRKPSVYWRGDGTPEMAAITN